MTFECYVRKSLTTGIPEYWAVEETGAECNLVFGSMGTSGRQRRTMKSGYGNLKSKEKLRSGYLLATKVSSIDDIDAAKRAMFGAVETLSSNAFLIYKAAMSLDQKPINSALNPSRKSAPTPKTVKAVLVPSVPAIPAFQPVVLTTVPKGAAADPWAW